MIDYILNGAGFGSVASALMETGFDVNVLRPWVGNDRNPYIVQNVQDPISGIWKPKAVMVRNTGITAALRKDDWIQLDDSIIRVAKPRLKAVSDLTGRGLTYTIPNGFGKTVLQHESMTDITEAEISMDANKDTKSDRPAFDLTNLPLPIIHKDFDFSTRQLAASRNGGSPLDTTTAELAGRRVAELAEQLLLGVYGTYTFGGGTLYGYTNFPNRMTKSMTLPTAGGWTGATLLGEILAMKQQSVDAFHYGPWVLYNSPAWDQYLDNDFSAAKGDLTLRERIKKVEGIEDVRTLDYLTAYQMVLVQMSSDVVREVIGMNMTTVQWEPTPFKVRFKVLCIMVPQLRNDINTKTGIVHGTAA
jgi:hypothetical protein